MDRGRIAGVSSSFILSSLYFTLWELHLPWPLGVLFLTFFLLSSCPLHLWNTKCIFWSHKLRKNLSLRTSQMLSSQIKHMWVVKGAEQLSWGPQPLAAAISFGFQSSYGSCLEICPKSEQGSCCRSHGGPRRSAVRARGSEGQGLLACHRCTEDAPPLIPKSTCFPALTQGIGC